METAGKQAAPAPREGIHFLDKRLAQAQTLLAREQVMEAVTLIKQVMASAPQDHQAIFLLAQAAEKAGEVQAALGFYARAQQLAPKESVYYLMHAECLSRRNHSGEAIAVLEAGTRALPSSLGLHLRLGLVHSIMGNIQEAMSAFERAIVLAPRAADGHAGLAVVLEMASELEKAETHARAALALNSAHHPARVVLAKVLRRTKRLEAARKENEEVLAAAVDPHVLGEAHVELAKTLEGLKLYDEAFPHFGKAQEVLASLSPVPEGPNIFNLMVEGCRKWFRQGTFPGWKPFTPPEGSPAPLFLVGFPRSGTTLMEQILSAHPDVVATQEKEFIATLVPNLNKVLGRPAAYPEALAELDEAQIVALRDLYWHKVRETLHFDPAEKRVLDKMPMNIAHLGVIARVFPEARIIVALRDPRDVILSCFVQSFTDNAAMSNFQTIEGTVRTYRDVMELYRQYKETLPELALHEVRYEDVVERMEEKARAMLAHAGIPWSDEVLRYYEKDKNRFVQTPSYEGVMQPVYKTSVAKWRRYEKQLSPHLGPLDPLMKAFGYAP